MIKTAFAIRAIKPISDNESLNAWKRLGESMAGAFQVGGAAMLLFSEDAQENFEEIAKAYVEKNTRYNNSFGRQFQKKGLSTTVLRIEDKFSRLETLAENPEDDGGDETIVDTLRDLANYSIMTIMELQKQGGE